MFWKILEFLCFHARIRFLISRFPDRIGHLAMEPVCYAKEYSLGLREGIRGIFALSNDEAANPAFVEVLKRLREHGLIVTTNPIVHHLAKRLATIERVTIDASIYSVAQRETASFYEIERQWFESGRGPVLHLSDEEERRGRDALAAMGIPGDAWFVCVHCRSAGFSKGDDRFHDYRNSPIESFVPAMEAIVEAGGWVIRMGDSSMPPLPEMKQVIDYATSDCKTPFLDIYFCATCRFFLGNTSGLILVANGFGVPVAWTNLAPLSAYPSPGSIGIPKRIFSEALDRELTLVEVMGTEAADYRMSYDYELAGLRVIDNTGEEIRDLTLEALARAEQKPIEQTEEDERLQARALELLRPGHYSFGTNGRFGRDFLRRHSQLLDGTDEDAENYKVQFMETKKKNEVNALALIARKDAKIKELRGRIRELEGRVKELEKEKGNSEK